MQGSNYSQPEKQTPEEEVQIKLPKSAVTELLNALNYLDSEYGLTNCQFYVKQTLESTLKK